MMFTYCPKCGKKGTVQKQDSTNYECANCQWHFWNNAKAATTLIFVKDGLILFGKRAIEPRKGKYDLPGGFVDFGETGYEGAIREAEEEVGAVIHQQDLELIGTFPSQYMDTVSTVDLIFIVHRWQGELIAGSDVAELVWRPLGQLRDPSFSQEDYGGLDELLAAKIPGLKQ